MIEEQESNILCCCEYINNQNEKSHLLGICCNCEDFDLFFTRCVTCSREPRNISKMLLTFQDRLRIPWRGGAKQISCGAIAPALFIPFSIAFAAINFYVTIVMFLSNLAFLIYAYFYVRSRKMRTNFFFMWLLWSVAYMVILFQLTVPLFEVLPEENFVLVLLTGGSIYFLYRTHKQQLTLNNEDHLEKSIIEEDESATSLLIEPDNSTKEPICKRCFRDSTSFHCEVCSSCILYRKHHSYWLNCCIGQGNYRYYIMGLLLAELSLLLGSNLTLTAICHPILIQRIGGISIMIPDDCSDVYEDYNLSVAFVIATYAIFMAIFVLLECIRQCYNYLRNRFWKREQSALPQSKSIWGNMRSNSSYLK